MLCSRLLYTTAQAEPLENVNEDIEKEHLNASNRRQTIQEKRSIVVSSGLLSLGESMLNPVEFLLPFLCHSADSIPVICSLTRGLVSGQKSVNAFTSP